VDEESLRAVTIGELSPYAVPVVVEDYDPEWPAWFEADRAEIVGALGERALLVDWLRTHDADRDRYAAVKRDLARQRWKHVQNYADAKTDIIKEIHARAGLP
jgi:GrpB-like predicted nucleotidyltransferase (UPF0157 family)